MSFMNFASSPLRKAALVILASSLGIGKTATLGIRLYRNVDGSSMHLIEAVLQRTRCVSASLQSSHFWA